MSYALSAGVTGLQAHQKMLDIAGNNLANVNTTAFKSKSINFAEVMTETIKKASQPTATLGGTNPQQLGGGVEVASISTNLTQGNIVNSGNPLDLAIEGEGYFVAKSGDQDLYTRAGAFAVDSGSYLVDPKNGYRVQRIGSVGEADGFQVAGNSGIRVPFDVALAANATTEVTMAGNLSADAVLSTPQTNVLTANLGYTTNSGITASAATELDQLDQFSGTLGTAPTITASGFDPSGNALVDAGLTVDGTTTLQDVIDHLNNNVLTATEQVASLVSGKIRVTDVASGYSLSDITLTWDPDDGTGTVTMPTYFEITTVGGDHIKNFNTTVYDTQGGPHVLSAAFTRTNTTNQWDMVLTSVTGNVNTLTAGNRRIRGIQFSAADGSYAGLDSGIGDTAQFTVTFAHDTANPQTISMALGTTGQLDGLTQFAGNSTAVARYQDGYEAGRLATVSVDQEGTLIGAFSNGIKKDIATLQIALFRNPMALENVGGNYFDFSANSGEPVGTEALTAGAGSVRGGALEKSNADVATEFVRMIQAQNGFQASARTIRVANDILRELTGIIR
ncbi:MAG: flagellar hook protein FlgE [Planctomycetota bacterium]|jgi:flagellar hook protein FlgE